MAMLSEVQCLFQSAVWINITLNLNKEAVLFSLIWIPIRNLTWLVLGGGGCYSLYVIQGSGTNQCFCTGGRVNIFVGLPRGKVNIVFACFSSFPEEKYQDFLVPSNTSADRASMTWPHSIWLNKLCAMSLSDHWDLQTRSYWSSRRSRQKPSGWGILHTQLQLFSTPCPFLSSNLLP